MVLDPMSCQRACGCAARPFQRRAAVPARVDVDVFPTMVRSGCARRGAHRWRAGAARARPLLSQTPNRNAFGAAAESRTKIRVARHSRRLPAGALTKTTRQGDLFADVESWRRH